MKEAAINRRKFIRDTGLGALAFNVAGAPVMLTPRAARAAGVEYGHLAAADAALLAAFADHVLPGAAAAAGVCSAVLPIDEIGGYVTNFVSRTMG